MTGRANEGWKVAFYRRLLRLYPASFREEFGAEMVDVFQQRLEEESARAPSAGVMCLAREVFDVPLAAARQAVREWSLSLRALAALGPARVARAWTRSQAPRISSCILGAAAGATVLLGAALADTQVLFMAPTQVVAGLGFAGIAVFLGRTCEAPSALARWRRRGLLLFLALSLVPALRVIELAGLHRQASRGTVLSVDIPGVTARAGSSWRVDDLPRARQGSIETRAFMGPSGEVVRTTFERRPDAPPYEVLAILAGGVVAALARRPPRRSRGDSASASWCVA